MLTHIGAQNTYTTDGKSREEGKVVQDKTVLVKVKLC